MFKQNIIELIEKEFGNSLLSADLWNNNNRLSLKGVNDNRAFYEIFIDINNYMSKKLSDMGFPDVKDYVLIDMEMNTLFVIIKLNSEYSLGALLDKSNIAVSTLTQVLIPKIIKEFNDKSY